MDDEPVRLTQIMVWGLQQIEGQYEYGAPAVNDKRIPLKRVTDGIYHVVINQ